MALGLEDNSMFGMEDEEEIRRRLMEQQLMNPTQAITGTGLGEQAIEAETGEEPIGPTPEVPFRFTQQELNPRASAARGGRTQRDPRARSPFQAGGFQPGGEFVMGLPTIDTTFGSGENTFGGRIFDINAIGQQMGIDQERINEIMGMSPQRQTTYSIGSPRYGNYEQFSSQKAVDRYLENQEAKHNARYGRYQAPNVRSSTRTLPISGLSDEEALLRGIAATYADPRTGTMQAFTKPGSKAAGEDTASLMRLGRTGRVIDPANMTPEQYEQRRRSQDRWFRKQGQQEGDDLFGSIIRSAIPAAFGAIAGIASGGALIPALGPIMGGITAGGIGGLTSGAAGGLISGDFDLANIAMSTGLGAAAGGFGGAIFGGAPTSPQVTGPFSVIGNAPQGISSNLGAAGALGNVGSAGQLPMYTAPGAGAVGEHIVASPRMVGHALNLATGTQSASNILAQNLVQAGIIGGGGGAPGLISRLREAARHPAARVGSATVQGGFRGAGVHRAQTMAEQAMMRSAGQASGTFGKRLQQSGIFQRRLPENEFYDPIEDVMSAQEGALN